MSNRITDAELAELEIYARKGDVYSRWKDKFGFDSLPVTVEVHEFMLRGWFESARSMSLLPGVDLHLAKLPDLLADLIAAREALRRLVKQLRTGDDSDIADAVQAAKEALGG